MNVTITYLPTPGWPPKVEILETPFEAKWALTSLAIEPDPKRGCWYLLVKQDKGGREYNPQIGSHPLPEGSSSYELLVHEADSLADYTAWLEDRVQSIVVDGLVYWLNPADSAEDQGDISGTSA